ncbi:unnamed protein product [Mytilus coruscus]|uniref:Uncharacterized protein n=1 Tax=Mytilus coruscus TaxID=42192 RepID=A0A6J8CKT2_MYTCO|nr:unnamed protein product [Mytilus coruscus]
MLLIGTAIGTTEAIYSTHENVSVGRFKNTSMCGVFALTQEKKTFHIISDGYNIDPTCSLYLIGVNNINNNYSFSGMCFKMSDIVLPCGRNDTLILRGWALDIRHKDQSILLYANQSMLVTEKILRCDNKQDFTMNYEFCWEKISMLEISFYSPNNPSSTLPKITVQSRVSIGPTYPALSLHDMETMKMQMDECKTCKVTTHQMYLDFLDRVILIANNNDKNNKNEDNNEEETSSASVDLNILLPSLFGTIATVVVAVLGAWKSITFCAKRGTKVTETSKHKEDGTGPQDTGNNDAGTSNDMANGNGNHGIGTKVTETSKHKEDGTGPQDTGNNDAGTSNDMANGNGNHGIGTKVTETSKHKEDGTGPQDTEDIVIETSNDKKDGNRTHDSGNKGTGTSNNKKPENGIHDIENIGTEASNDSEDEHGTPDSEEAAREKEKLLK